MDTPLVVKGYRIRSFANLAGADLAGANLAGANLARANLTRASLTGADLTRADLTRASLTGADLTRAILVGANLAGANLTGADLTGADLAGVNLVGASLAGAVGLATFRITPDGAFTAYKKLASGEVATLEVPADAGRVNAYGSRKIRVSAVRVIAVRGPRGVGRRTGLLYPGVLYEPGASLRVDDFDPDPRAARSRGLHVFLTREEAEVW